MEKEKPGLVDFLILPLKWLEQSKGWKRRGLAFLYLLIFTIAMLLSWRELHLWRLPNLREPFDEAKYGTVEVADSDNAMPLYKEAAGLLKPEPAEVKRLYFKGWTFNDWAKLDPAVQHWVEENRPALVPWLQATERSDALIVQPNQMRITTNLEPVQSIRTLARLALFEGARRRESGDLEGAWVYYRGVLRSSRHVGRNGLLIQRLSGSGVLKTCLSYANQWIDSPATTSALLKWAIRDVEACRLMTPPISEMIRIEYFSTKDALSHPEKWIEYGVDHPQEYNTNWYIHLPGATRARTFLLREPERSHRVNRLVTAGLLAQCERPRWARPKMSSNNFSIFEIDPKTPRAVASISPEALAGWAEHSAYAGLVSSYNNFIPRLEAEPAVFDEILLRMAERAYQIEHGKPAKTYADLLGAYLKELPEGIEPVDPIGAPNTPQ
jgi:hypothetical protein